jgi:hypothetical protein
MTAHAQEENLGDASRASHELRGVGRGAKHRPSVPVFLRE